MTVLFFAGIAVAALGLAGVFWFIQRVRRMKRMQDNDPALQAELRFLVVLNMGAVGLAFMGLAMAVMGLILS